MSSYASGGLPNLQRPYLIPEEFRARHQLMIRTLDEAFKPKLTNILPPAPAIGADGAIGVERFDWPVMVSGRPAAELYDRDEPVRSWINDVAMRTEHFQTQISKAGFIRYYDEFKHDFIGNVIGEKYRILAEEMIDALNKRVEIEIANVLYHNTSALKIYNAGYTDFLDRALVADIPNGNFLRYDHSTTITDLADMLSGSAWGRNNTGDPINDINVCKMAHEEMKSTDLTQLFAGPETVGFLGMNHRTRELVKYVKDASNNVIGSTMAGIQIHKVIGNDLKDYPFYSGSSSPPFGYPGQGDVDHDRWGRRNRQPIMVDGGIKGREWALLTTSRVGFTHHSWINTKHQARSASPTEPYVQVWEENDPEQTKILSSKAFCPTIEDWADSVLLLNTVNRSNRTA